MPHTLSENLYVGWLNYQDLHGRCVFCRRQFELLMNQQRLPRKIKVTISTRPIPGAACVPVLLITPWVDWIDWNGRRRRVTWGAAADYLRRIGVPRGRWTEIWIDWAVPDSK